MRTLQGLVLLFVVWCSMGAGPCWVKHYPVINPVVVPLGQYPVQYIAPVYYPVVIQEKVWVPVMQQRLEYQPVVGQFFMNYSHYYNAPLYYSNNSYYYNSWSGYNY